MQKEKEYNRRRGGSAASLLYEKVGENPAFFAVMLHCGIDRRQVIGK